MIKESAVVFCGSRMQNDECGFYLQYVTLTSSSDVTPTSSPYQHAATMSRLPGCAMSINSGWPLRRKSSNRQKAKAPRRPRTCGKCWPIKVWLPSGLRLPITGILRPHCWRWKPASMSMWRSPAHTISVRAGCWWMPRRRLERWYK